MMNKNTDITDFSITRAGILPFFVNADGAVEYMFMTPHHKKGFTPPKDQICKGGRWVKKDGVWQDMDDRNLASTDGLELESFSDTAIREGKEELGLREQNIAKLYDVGVVEFISEKKKNRTKMYMFAAEVKSKTDFDDVVNVPNAPVAKVQWMTLEKFGNQGREDHVPIVESIVEKLHSL